jgi:regulator of sigma E protease
MDQITNSFIGVVWLVLGFGFIIFVHELGHFLVAKAVGIKVTQFAVGFGHAVITWRRGIGFRNGSTEAELERRVRTHLRAQNEGTQDMTEADADGAEASAEHSARQDAAMLELGLGETEYRLNWMPLGGYVKMLGQEDLDPEAASNDPRSFSAKPVWARACVISAGVIMNLIFGLIFFVIAFSNGVRFPRAIVGDVGPTAPAAKVYAEGHADDPDYLGLRVGDRVVEIDGKAVQDFMDLAASVLLARKGDHLRISVERPGTDEQLDYIIQPQVDEDSHLLSIGIATPVTTRIGKLAEKGKLYKAGVKPDWKLTKAAGQPVEQFYQYDRVITAAAGVPVDVTFSDPDGGQSITVPLAATPQLPVDDAGVSNLLGLVPPTLVAGFPERSEKEDPTPAQEAGMEVDDLVAQVGSVAWPTHKQIVAEVKLATARNELPTVSVWRDGKTVSLGRIKPDNKQRLGFFSRPALASLVIGRSLPGSPIAELKLNPGSRILSIDGKNVSSWADLQRQVQTTIATAGNNDVKVKIEYELNLKGKPKDAGTVSIDRDTAVQLAAAGWRQPIALYNFDLNKKLVLSESVGQAVELGMEKTGQFVIQTYVTIARLFQGSVNITDLRGPVGIIHIGTKIAAERWTYMLFFFGLISVNLVVINFLPMPIVDGGLMVFLIIEKIKGSPVSPRILSAANMAGLVMLGCLFITLTYYDVTRWATGG